MVSRQKRELGSDTVPHSFATGCSATSTWNRVHHLPILSQEHLHKPIPKASLILQNNNSCQHDFN
jgi:hypothetical protein